MIQNLEKKLKFIELVDEMKMIKRSILKVNKQEETDAEHSYHLAMIVMTFIDDFPMLDYSKCLKMALVHDIVEIYAGDTRFLDKESEKTKHQREKESFEKLKKDFYNELPEIIDLIDAYEKKECLESKFVKSLDRIQPIIQIVMEGLETWEKRPYDLVEVKKLSYEKIYSGFGFEKILDIYFERAEKEKIYYKKGIENKWTTPHITKIYEAFSALADKRIEILQEENNLIKAKVYSSSGNKFYIVNYDKRISIMSNDNYSYYKGNLGYPSIALLLKTGYLEISEEIINKFKNIKWKDINVKNNNDFDKTQKEIEKILNIQNDLLQKYTDNIFEKLQNLDLRYFGEKTIPPEGY